MSVRNKALRFFLNTLVHAYTVLVCYFVAVLIMSNVDCLTLAIISGISKDLALLIASHFWSAWLMSAVPLAIVIAIVLFTKNIRDEKARKKLSEEK